MRILACLLLAYTLGMLFIHVSTWKLLEAWDRPAESWIKRQLPPLRVIRVEAIYWLFGLASLAILPLWPSFFWKAMVVVFAVIHLGVWLVAELRGIQWTVKEVPPAQTGKAHRLIIAFDLVEACALVAIAWLTLSYVLQTGQRLVT